MHTPGLKPLRSDGLEKVKAGITSIAEIHGATPAVQAYRADPGLHNFTLFYTLAPLTAIFP